MEESTYRVADRRHLPRECCQRRRLLQTRVITRFVKKVRKTLQSDNLDEIEQQLGHMARECQNQASKDHPQAAAKSFFMPGDAFAQLQNLSSHMAFTVVSETLDGTPDKLENEADWDTPNDEPEPQAASCKPNIHNFVGLIWEPARGLTDTGAQQPVLGASAGQWWCE